MAIKNNTPVEDTVIIEKEPWYASKGLMAQMAQMIIGGLLAAGVITEDQRTVLDGAIVPVAGALGVVIAVFSIYMQANIVKFR